MPEVMAVPCGQRCWNVYLPVALFHYRGTYLRVALRPVAVGSVSQIPPQFLAKLAANLAKPKGVCVLPRRDVSAVLAATPATKIPGCGAGSATAKQFAALGARTILDLRRIEAPEMRQRLGEQQGTKVYDSVLLRPLTMGFADEVMCCDGSVITKVFAVIEWVYDTFRRPLFGTVTSSVQGVLAGA